MNIVFVSVGSEVSTVLRLEGYTYKSLSASLVLPVNQAWAHCLQCHFTFSKVNIEHTRQVNRSSVSHFSLCREYERQVCYGTMPSSTTPLRQQPNSTPHYVFGPVPSQPMPQLRYEQGRYPIQS